MNPLDRTQKALGISRRELCRRLGLSHKAGIEYSHDRQPIPRYVILACLALEHGLSEEMELRALADIHAEEKRLGLD